MNWQRIHKGELQQWQGRLLAAGAPMFQFPSWLEGFEHISFFKPQYYSYAVGHAWAYCGLLMVNLGIVKVALVSHGPVSGGGDDAFKEDALNALLAMLKKQGCTFARFSGDVVHSIPALQTKYSIIDNRETFPFYRDVTLHYYIANTGSAESIKSSFSASARTKINKIEKAGIYRYETDTEGKYADAVYELFTRTGRRKGFTYRPKESYAALFHNNSTNNFASYYLCFKDDVLVNALVVLRDKHNSLYMSGALDTELIDENRSPATSLHYYAMQQEFTNWHTQRYDLIYTGGAVGKFKQRFHPQYIAEPTPVTVVFNKTMFALYERVILRFTPVLKKMGRKIISFIRR